MIEDLTPREAEVMQVWVNHPAATKAEVARQLELSAETVSTYTHRAYLKLQVQTRLAGVLKCLQLGICRL